MKTFRYILIRLAQAIPVLLGVSIITFVLMAATPGDPVRLLVGDRATPETIAAIRDQYGLDEPVLIQYFTYLGNVVQGDLGASLRYRLPVFDLIVQHYPVTLFLVIYTIILTLPPVIILAVLSARNPNGFADQVIRILGVLGLAVPVFWLSLLFAR
ncbi:MAG: ABC transporter permease, partial [Pseudomonadota bacterium]